jgi:hypothetical protein
MKRTTITAAIAATILFLFGSVVNAQSTPVEHAPTAAVCQAEQQLWLVEYREWLGATDKTKTTVNALTVSQILHRQIEMTDCTTIVFDSKPGQSTDVIDPYLSVSQDYASIASNRYSSFLRRHHLMHQLEQEDAAGAR